MVCETIQGTDQLIHPPHSQHSQLQMVTMNYLFFSKFWNERNYFSATENDEKDEKRGNGSGLRDLAFDISRVSLKSGDTATTLHCATYQ